MRLRLLRLYPLKRFSLVGEASIGIHFVNASTILFDDVSDIEIFRHAPVAIRNCLPLDVEIAMFLNIHRPKSSKSVRAYIYLIQSLDVECSHPAGEVIA
jgi:hypothetical protein